MNFQVAILSYNHPELTQRCIESIRRFVPDDNIHLFHNGSRQKVVEDLAECCSRVQHHFRQNNIGFSGGANWALEKIFQMSDWALFVTNDCELLSLDLQRQKLSPGIYAPKVFRRRTQKLDSLGGQIDFRRGQLQHLKENNPQAVQGGQFYVPGTVFLVDRESHYALGGFDTSLGTYWEDVDYSLRAHSMGIGLYQTESIVLRHGIGKTCHKDPFYTNYLFQRNRIRVCRRWKAGSEYRFLSETLASSFKRARAGQWPQAWQRLRAYWDA